MKNKKKNYCECLVCGCEFMITLGAVYLVQDEPTLADRLSCKAPTVFNAIDCPNCGCQMILKGRIPKVVINAKALPETPKGD